MSGIVGDIVIAMSDGVGAAVARAASLLSAGLLLAMVGYFVSDISPDFSRVRSFPAPTRALKGRTFRCAVMSLLFLSSRTDFSR